MTESRRYVDFDGTQIRRARELCREVKELADETRLTLAQTRRILAGRGATPVRVEAAVPLPEVSDGLCRLFDSLIVACRHADADGDAETIALMERLVMHVGGRIDRRLDPLEPVPGLQ